MRSENSFPTCEPRGPVVRYFLRRLLDSLEHMVVSYTEYTNAGLASRTYHALSPTSVVAKMFVLSESVQAATPVGSPSNIVPRGNPVSRSYGDQNASRPQLGTVLITPRTAKNRGYQVFKPTVRAPRTYPTSPLRRDCRGPSRGGFCARLCMLSSTRSHLPVRPINVRKMVIWLIIRWISDAHAGGKTNISCECSSTSTGVEWRVIFDESCRHVDGELVLDIV